MMDEYITKNNAISAVCFGCNQEFSDNPCEPDACAIRQSIKALPTADVTPNTEVEAIINALDNSTKEFLKLHDDYQKQKSEVDKWVGRCRDWHEVSELKSQRIVELEAELSKEKGKVEKIFAEIEKYKRSPMPECKPVYVINYSSFAELKKKYTEDKT